MKTKFKKNYLSLAISTMLLLAVANSNGAENAGVSVDSAVQQRNSAPSATTTRLVSINSTGTASGNQFSDFPALSADGRFVAFVSFANDLAANDTNGNIDVFVRDLITGTTKLVSINSTGTASGNGDCFSPVLSANGRFVAFQCNANDLVANDTNGTTDVFVRDLKTGTTRLVSVNSAGTASGNESSGAPRLSADGRFVAFVSSANDLVANDTNGNWDVFVRDLTTGTTTLASVYSAGTVRGNFDSLYPVLSADGRFVAFQTVENSLNPFFVRNVFVRDLKTGVASLVSVNSSGTGNGNKSSSNPVLSADGRFVAFNSFADDLVANDTNGITDVFLRDLKTGTTRLVSINSSGTASGNESSGSPRLSSNGRFVAFISFANDLVANDTNGSGDIFVRDLKTGTTRLVSVNSAGTASGNDLSFGQVLSADGRFVAFNSFADDLVANDTNGITDVFLRDLKTGTTRLVSINSSGTASGNYVSADSVLSADGRFVAFSSEASDLVANDTNGTRDVFVRPTGR